jgi:hypothetical protein
MVGECLRNNTTLMLSLYLSLFLYSFALLQLGRGRGQQNWGCWLLWCLHSSDGVHRCSKLLPVVEPKGFSPDPHVNHQLHSQSPHPSNLTTVREKGAGKDEEKKKMCVCLCVGFFLTGNDSSVGSRDNGGWFFFSILVQDGLFSIKRKSAHDAATTTNLFSPTLLAYHLNPKLLLLNCIPTTTKRRRRRRRRRRTRTRGSCRTRTKSR